MFKLSSRLQKIYDHLLPGKPLWDLCCDHGYVGLKAWSSGDFPEIHFVDRVPLIIERLKLKFREFPDNSVAEKSITAHFWPIAAENLEKEIRGTVIAAGVGGCAIEKILRSLDEKSILRADRLVICPQDHLEHIDKNLRCSLNLKYEISNRLIILERNRERTLWIFDKV